MSSRPSSSTPMTRPAGARLRQDAQGRLWAYLRDESPAAADARAGGHVLYSVTPRNIPPDYIGMADAYAGFDGLYIARRPIIEAACWSTRAAQSYSSSPSCRRRRSLAKTLSAMAASSLGSQFTSILITKLFNNAILPKCFNLELCSH